MKKHLVIILLIPILFAIGIFSTPWLHQYDAGIPRTITDINAISTALDLFRLNNLSYPTEQEGLTLLVKTSLGNTELPIYKNWSGPYLRQIPKDSWENEYIYRRIEGGISFLVYSRGPNGLDDHGLHDDVTGEWKKYDCKLFDNCRSFMHKYGIWSFPIAALLFLYVLGYWGQYLIRKAILRIKKR